MVPIPILRYPIKQEYNVASFDVDFYIYNIVLMVHMFAYHVNTVNKRLC